MSPPPSFGTCDRCGFERKVPLFSHEPVSLDCPLCEGAENAGLEEARRFIHETYIQSSPKDCALALTSYAGQYVTALLSGEKAAARAFLVNVIALGELLLAE